jgi:hypothetical protein
MYNAAHLFLMTMRQAQGAYFILLDYVMPQ